MTDQNHAQNAAPAMSLKPAHCRLKPLLAAGRAAVTGHAPLVRSRTVIHGEFRAGRDLPEGVDLNAITVDAKVAVRTATVIEVLERRNFRTIECPPAAQLNQVDLRLEFR